MTKVHDTTMEIPLGFYDFTVPQNYRQSLDSWIEWFKYKEMETVVIQNSKGQFILCVKGKEIKAYEGPDVRKKLLRLPVHATPGM